MQTDLAEDGIVEQSWQHYERAVLPADATEHERRIAKQGFLQGAQALYGVVYMALLMAETQEDFVGALEQLAVELGVDEYGVRPS